MNKKASEIIIACGSGGVGKTTISASIALKKALEGKKAVVLTIDPAKRLATSLGISSLDDMPKKVPLAKAKGELYAMMLDTKKTFDRLVERYSPNEETKERILNNKLYNHVSDMMAGTQEYMAMERLHEIDQSQEYDCIVIDTPPMQNAMDFFAAPEKMRNMINNSMLHLLLKPSLKFSKVSLNLFERGTQAILKVFDRVAGFAFLQDISEMLIAFKDLLDGFEKRASEVKVIFERKQTHFTLVCSTQSHSQSEAENFANFLKDQNLNLSEVIVNRICPGPALSDKELNELIKQKPSKTLETLILNYQSYLPQIRHDEEILKKLTKQLPQTKITSVPLMPEDVCHLNALQKISAHL